MLPAEVVHRHSVPVLIESMCTHTHEGKSKILTVFELVWAPRDIGLHRLDQQCAHAWAFQAVQTVWLCPRKTVPVNLSKILPLCCAETAGILGLPLHRTLPWGFIYTTQPPVGRSDLATAHGRGEYPQKGPFCDAGTSACPTPARPAVCAH